MKKILIIEDDLSVRIGLQDLLEENDYIVLSAPDGKEGIKSAKKNLPDLIVCDILMPGLDGMQVLKELSRNINTAIIPFIFLTAKAEMKDVREGMAQGANDYIIKPYDAQDLLNAVKKRLQKVEVFRSSINENIENSEQIPRLNENDRLFLENRLKAGFFKIESISYISSDNVYSRVFSKNKDGILVRRTLKKWEEILPANFIRIHRSVIINLDHVTKTEKSQNRSYKVFLEGANTSFNISQRYYSLLKIKNKLNEL